MDFSEVVLTTIRHRKDPLPIATANCISAYHIVPISVFGIFASSSLFAAAVCGGQSERHLSELSE